MCLFETSYCMGASPVAFSGGHRLESRINLSLTPPFSLPPFPPQGGSVWHLRGEGNEPFLGHPQRVRGLQDPERGKIRRRGGVPAGVPDVGGGGGGHNHGETAQEGEMRGERERGREGRRERIYWNTGS